MLVKNLNSVSMALEGADGATDPTASTSYKTGFGVDNAVGRIGMLEEDGTSKIIMKMVLVINLVLKNLLLTLLD